MKDLRLTYLLSSWFGRAIVALLLLNFVDAVATVIWVKGGYAEELNPLMHEWIMIGPPFFAFLKLGIVSLCLYLIWKFREVTLAKILLVPIVVLYVCVFFIHVLIASHVFG